MTAPAAHNHHRHIKRVLYILIGFILQAAILLIFVLTIMHIRSPKVSFASVSLQNQTPNSTGLQIRAQLKVKNTNFGRFGFESTTVTVSQRGTPVGEAAVGKGSVKGRSAKKFDVAVNLNSTEEERLELTSEATLRGVVRLFKVFRKKESVRLNCSMEVDVREGQIGNLTCS